MKCPRSAFAGCNEPLPVLLSVDGDVVDIAADEAARARRLRPVQRRRDRPAEVDLPAGISRLPDRVPHEIRDDRHPAEGRYEPKWHIDHRVRLRRLGHDQPASAAPYCPPSERGRGKKRGRADRMQTRIAVRNRPAGSSPSGLAGHRPMVMSHEFRCMLLGTCPSAEGARTQRRTVGVPIMAHRRSHRDGSNDGEEGTGAPDRPQVEKALPATGATLHRLAERSQDIVYRYRLEPDPVLEYVSPAATRLTGYTPEEFYADFDLWTRLVHPDDRARVVLAGQHGNPDEPVVARWMRRDGSTLWAEDRRVWIVDADGAVVAIEGIARDVTERVEAEQRLRASEMRFRNLLSDIDLCSLMLDAEGRVEFINDHMLNFCAAPATRCSAGTGSTQPRPHATAKQTGSSSGLPSLRDAVPVRVRPAS